MITDVFVQHSAIFATGFNELNEGDKGAFEIEKEQKGPLIKDVTKE